MKQMKQMGTYLVKVQKSSKNKANDSNGYLVHAQKDC
jgi:hypothetical protein